MAGNFLPSAGSAPHTAVATVAPDTRRTIRSVPLSVGGQHISIRTDQSPDYLVSLANEVNGIIESLRQRSPNSGVPQLMAMAAVMLADRAVCAERCAEQEAAKVEQHIERLSMILKSLDDGELQQ